MAFCGNCGAKIEDGTKFCGVCGLKTDGTGQAEQPRQEGPAAGGTQQQSSFESLKQKATNTADFSGDMDPADIEQNKVMGGLAYFIFFLPLLACPNSKYGRFHSNQGLLYLLLCIAGAIVTSILSAILFAISWRLYFLVALISWVVWIAIAVFGILGLINGFSGKAKELPLIGSIRIIK